ncbi:MAG: prepilin-type N-terminal cleavage/methylation domain-containing protein [Gemmatimonadaceae bacterium]
MNTPQSMYTRAATGSRVLRLASPLSRPAGFTLLEVLLVLLVVALILAIAMPRFLVLQDRLAAHGAASVLTRALLDARHFAVRRGERTALKVDTTTATVVVAATTDTLGLHRLHDIFGVSIAATRDSIAYAPSGLGYGAANTRYVVSRGAAAETITVSRVGRLRR